jgi:hypothetical protein
METFVIEAVLYYRCPTLASHPTIGIPKSFANNSGYTFALLVPAVSDDRLVRQQVMRAVSA